MEVKPKIYGEYELGVYKILCPKCGARIIEEKCENCGVTNQFIESETIMGLMGQIQKQADNLKKLIDENERLRSKVIFNPTWLIK